MSNHSQRGFHHGYLGLFILLTGFLAIWLDQHLAIGLLAIGAILFLDDTVQHMIGVYYNSEYKSLLHKLYGKLLYRYKWVQILNKLFDKLFGRRES